MGAGEPSKKNFFTEIFFPSKNVEPKFGEVFGTFKCFFFFFGQFETYLDSPEEVPPEIMGPQTNSTLHMSQRMFGQKFDPVSQTKFV